MNKGNYICGLDIGSTKICAVVGEIIDGRLEIRGIGTSPSTGVRKGMVVNIEPTVESIKKAVKEAEINTGVCIDSAYVGITGIHIKGFNSYGAVGIKKGEVTTLDVEQAIESSKAIYIPIDREVIQVIPSGYILDGQDGINDPVGMTGVRLEAKVHIITASTTSVQNIIRCCEKADLEPIEVVFQPIASAEAVLTNDEKDLGVAFADIGGTTDIVLFKDGRLLHFSVLPVGGPHFTNDIAIGFRLSLSEAERLKKSFGHAIANIVDKNEMIDIVQAGQERKIPSRYLSEIIQPRAEELLVLIKNELQCISAYDVASSGIVLTGGGSLLAGLDRMAEAILELPVRIGYPDSINGCKGDINSPVYATGIGLVLYGFNRESREFSYRCDTRGIIMKMRSWVSEVFR
ncbi:MAG: cell division protein FtsA [Nitrospirae bacterium]|nr:cell division protein FtsA [Nitrospirota bacterium]